MIMMIVALTKLKSFIFRQKESKLVNLKAYCKIPQILLF